MSSRNKCMCVTRMYLMQSWLHNKSLRVREQTVQHDNKTCSHMSICCTCDICVHVCVAYRYEVRLELIYAYYVRIYTICGFGTPLCWSKRCQRLYSNIYTKFIASSWQNARESRTDLSNNGVTGAPKRTAMLTKRSAARIHKSTSNSTRKTLK